MAYYIHGPSDPTKDCLQFTQGCGTGLALADYTQYLAKEHPENAQHNKYLFSGLYDSVNHRQANTFLNKEYFGWTKEKMTETEEHHIRAQTRKADEVTSTIKTVNPFFKHMKLCELILSEFDKQEQEPNDLNKLEYFPVSSSYIVQQLQTASLSSKTPKRLFYN
jgi:hypothetical protein